MKYSSPKLLTSLAILAATTALATHAVADENKESESSIQHGLYGGVAAGIRLDRNDFKTAVDDGTGAPITTFRNSFDITDESFTGGFQLGYEGRFAQYYYISLEGDILFGNSEAQKQVFNAQPIGFPGRRTIDTSIKGKNRYGLAARLGGYWNQALLYIRLGVEWQEFKISTSTSNITADPAGNPFSPSLNKSYTRAAFTPGAGIEMDLFENASLGIEYRVALYSKKTETAPPPFDPDDVAPIVVRHKPRTDTIMVRFNYKLIKFDS